MQISQLERLNNARGARQAAVVLTNLGDGSSQLLLAGDFTGHVLSDEILARVKSGKSGTVETGEGEVFIHVHVPSPKLVVIGAVHISQALVPMAKACGFEVSVIDPRTAFATPDRFADVTLYSDWPIDILKDHPLDPFTALVAVTHDPKIDDIPLHNALDVGCFYVGALGSRKTHAKRVGRLWEMGCSTKQTDQIHAPIGLDIGAATPAEIAVAILAEIIESRRKKGVI